MGNIAPPSSALNGDVPPRRDRRDFPAQNGSTGAGHPLLPSSRPGGSVLPSRLPHLGHLHEAGAGVGAQAKPRGLPRLLARASALGAVYARGRRLALAGGLPAHAGEGAEHRRPQQGHQHARRLQVHVDFVPVQPFAARRGFDAGQRLRAAVLERWKHRGRKGERPAELELHDDAPGALVVKGVAGTRLGEVRDAVGLAGGLELAQQLGVGQAELSHGYGSTQTAAKRGGFRPSARQAWPGAWRGCSRGARPPAHPVAGGTPWPSVAVPDVWGRMAIGVDEEQPASFPVDHRHCIPILLGFVKGPPSLVRRGSYFIGVVRGSRRGHQMRHASATCSMTGSPPVGSRMATASKR